MTLSVGTRAPDFTLPQHGGPPVQLRTLLTQGPVVLYFYPKDNTLGCTAEACAFRDAYQDFSDAGAQVVGVSADPPDSHQRFASKHRLPFTLLSDEHAEVRRLYGVGKTLGLLDGRVTFVIDPAGQIRHVFNSQINATRHVKEALGVIRQLHRAGAGAAPPA